VSWGSVVPRGPRGRRLGVGTILWALVPALSLGFLAPVPFAHAAVRLGRPRMWAVTAAYGIGSLVAFVFASGPEGGWGDAVLGPLVAALMIVGTAHAFVLRGRVFGPSRAVAAAPAAGRREEARAIGDRPERPSPGDGEGVPAVVPSTPPASDPFTPPARDPLRNLGRVFTLEVVLALLVLLLGWVLLLAGASCQSARCSNLYGFAWGELMVVSSALLIGCAALFVVGSATKRAVVKRWAVQLLPIGTVAAWAVYIVISRIALGP
jgi:hypothetical protein